MVGPPTAWGWGCRSAARSSKRMADDYGRAPMHPGARSSNSPCPLFEGMRRRGEIAAGSITATPPQDHVETHCGQEHQPRRNAFEVARQAEKIEAVPHACDQDRAKKHAHRAATPAKQARAANHRSRNRVQREGASSSGGVDRKLPRG